MTFPEVIANKRTYVYERQYSTVTFCAVSEDR